MVTVDKALIEQALEALKDYHKADDDRLSVAMRLLSQAIEQAEQAQTVAWRLWDEDPLGGTDHRWCYFDKTDFADGVDPTKHFKVEPLYTSPPPRQPLTDEQRQKLINKAWNEYLRGDGHDSFSWFLSIAIEAAHGIKGEA